MHPFSNLQVPEGRVGIHWFYQNCFAFKDSRGTVVQVDPYFLRERPPEKFIHAEPPLNEADLRTDFVIATHNHRDHTCIESLQRIHAAFPDCRFLGPVESVANMRQNGIAADRTQVIEAGKTVSLGDLPLHAFWSKPPQGAPEDGIRAPDTTHLGVVLEIGSHRIYISGDAINTFADHDELTAPIAAVKPDIAILTTHPTEGEFPFFEGSAALARKLGVATAIPAHYHCFRKRTYDPREWAACFTGDGPQPLIIPFNDSVIL
jgi:L-ascorbate metabolism protein UlaG (beta-lactamase superfamily)